SLWHFLDDDLLVVTVHAVPVLCCQGVAIIIYCLETITICTCRCDVVVLLSVSELVQVVGIIVVHHMTSLCLFVIMYTGLNVGFDNAHFSNNSADCNILIE